MVRARPTSQLDQDTPQVGQLKSRSIDFASLAADRTVPCSEGCQRLRLPVTWIAESFRAEYCWSGRRHLERNPARKRKVESCIVSTNARTL